MSGRGRALALVIVTVVATCCSSTPDDRSAGTSGPADDESVPALPATDLVDPTTATPTTSGRGYVAPSTTLPGRAAPDVTVGDVEVSSIRVFADPSTGRFATSANVTNSGAAFLNDLRLGVTVLDAGGATLDRIEAAIPTLGAGETTAVVAVGDNAYVDSWADIEIEHDSAAT